MARQKNQTEKQGLLAAVKPRILAAAAAAAALAVIIYLPARNMPFFFDDRVTIILNEKIQSSSLADAVRENPFRAVPNLTFALQARLNAWSLLPPNAYSLPASTPYISRKFDEKFKRYFAFYTDFRTGESVPVSIDQSRNVIFPIPKPAPFHRFNLAIHLINALLLFLVLIKLAPAHRAAAALAAVIFLVHPLATESVNYITARFTLMAAMFSLGSVCAWFYWEESTAGRTAAAGLFVLALFCKETAVALPLMVFIIEAARGRYSPRLLWWLIPAAVYALLRIFFWPVIVEGPGGALLSWHQYLLVEQRVTWSYLLKAIWPLHLNFDPHVIPGGFSDYLSALANLIILSGAGFILIRRVMRLRGQGKADQGGPRDSKNIKSGKRNDAAPLPQIPAWAAAVALLAWLALAPTSSVIPLADLAKEDRAYPLLIILTPALVMALASITTAAGDARAAAGKNAVTACAVLIIALLSTLCFMRNLAWSSEKSLTRDMLMNSPQKPRAVYQYATALKWSGGLAQSLFWYERARELDPTNPDILVNLQVLKKAIEEGGQNPGL